MTENINTQFHQVKSKSDAECFLEQTNALHDGYVIRVRYEHRGHTPGNPHYIDPSFTELSVRIMVTSIRDAVVELVFQNVSEWQIKDSQQDIIEASVSFTSDGNIIWTDDTPASPEALSEGSYVIAKKMKWRFL